MRFLIHQQVREGLWIILADNLIGQTLSPFGESLWRFLATHEGYICWGNVEFFFWVANLHMSRVACKNMHVVLYIGMCIHQNRFTRSAHEKASLSMDGPGTDEETHFL